MSEIISAPFAFVKTILTTFLTTVTLPFKFILLLFYYIYKIVFSLQFFMAGACTTMFGDGFGCDIINPNYVFTTMIIALLKFIFISHMGKAIYKIWNKK